MRQASLYFCSGERQGSTVELTRTRTVIGRASGNLVLSDDGEISSIHALISFERGAWHVMDLGSTNGVFVDGEVVFDHELTDGTELRIGQTRMRFVLPDAEAQTDAMPAVLLDDDATSPHAPRGGTVVNIDGKKALAGYEPPPPSATEPDAETPASPLKAGPGVVVRLEITAGADRGMVHDFCADSIVLGRNEGDLLLRDADVSRRHAVIEVFDAGNVFVRDLDSTNGTFVGSERVTSRKLRSGDVLRMGRCELKFSTRALRANADPPDALGLASSQPTGSSRRG